MNCRAVRNRPLVRICIIASVAGLAQLIARPAFATANVGIDSGVVSRGTSGSPSLSPGFGIGSHIEVGPCDYINFGLYYLLSVNKFTEDSKKDALFNTLGVRTRLVWPLGDFKPYAWIGLGPSWSKYRMPDGTVISGSFWETPVGLGVGYRVLELFQVAVEGAYRPSSGFTGTAYEAARFPTPSSGWSALLALSLDV